MSEELYVFDWYSLDIEEDDDESSEGSDDPNAKKRYQCQKKFIVKAFCLTPDNGTVVLNIHDFNPFYYVKVPSNWGATHANMFVRGLKGKVKKWVEGTLVEWKLINAKPLYGFTADDKFRYIKLTFSCLAGFYGYRNVLNEPLRLFGLNDNSPHTYELYEANMPPLLRFMHCKNLKAAGWLRVDGARVHFVNSTTCQRELTVKADGINPIDDDERGIPAIKYMGFDIEADSSHGDFPLANKDYQKLARDIVTDYNMVKDEIKYSDMRPMVATYLKYAFHPHYNNNNIKSVALVGGRLPEIFEILSPVPFEAIAGLNQTIEHWLEPIYEILCEGAVGCKLGEGEKIDIHGSGVADENIVMRLLEIFEAYFPTLDIQTCDYYSCAEQLTVEYNRLVHVNDPVVLESPKAVVRLLLTLCFDPYYNNLNINRIYTKARIPALDLCKNLVPKIHTICEKAYRIVRTERKAVRYRKMGSKYKIEKTSETSDDCVSELCGIFNQYFPEVQDDRVIQIGSTIKKYGETDCYLKHIICLGETETISNNTMIDFEYIGVELPKKELKSIGAQFPDIKDIAELNRLELEQRKQRQYETDKAEVIVKYYDTEEEVLLAWKDLVLEQDPDLIVGYNTFGFDYKYLYDRAEQLGITEEFTQLGRIKGVSQQLIEKKLQSAGLGDNLLHYVEMHGRVSVDLYKVMQKMEKLNSYKLDSVCKEFLYKSKIDVSPAEIFVRQKGTAADRRIVAEYCLIDCVLCVRLMDKFELILNNIGMAQVCSVPFSFLFLRGQGIKLFSFVAKICREQGYLIPVLGEPEDEGKYEGAIVLEPDKGIHDKPVVVADFNSLYPSCIISENLSHNSFVGCKIVKKGEKTEYRGQCLNVNNKYERSLVYGEYPGWDYVDIPYDIYKDVPVAPGRKKTKKIVIGHKICRFSQPPDGKKDIIPTILQDLLKARGVAKNTMNNYPKGSFKYNVYDGLQSAYKVTANSLYGILGASTSPIRMREIAACTTATGRKLINFSAAFVKNNYKGSDITYGDTDSIFCKFLCKDRYGNELHGLDAVNKSIILCTEAAMLISKQLKAPHNLEFEKAILPFILLSKKRYHGHYYLKYGSPEFEPKSMGIVLKRRDNAPIVKHIFGGMIDIIMNELSIEKAMQFVRDECVKVLRGEFPMDMFIIAKTLRSYYKNPTQIAHNVLAQRIGKRDPGNKPRGNDRIAYAFIVNPDAESQGDMIETPQYIQDNGCKLDYAYYITHQIAKPVTQIFELAKTGETLFDDLLREYANMGWRKITEYKCIKTFKLADMKIKDLWANDGVNSDGEEDDGDVFEDHTDIGEDGYDSEGDIIDDL
jgi:DNA polymerase elongation subunit (family B)